MKIAKFLFALVATGVFIYLLNTTFVTNKAPIPAIGKLLNPATGFWQNAEAKGFYTQIKPIPTSGLKEAVKVVYDDRLVPHIFAQNTEDALFAQGYTLAQHRLWQMDFSVRSTAGRLSEILGPRLLPIDQDKRRKGMQFGAENSIEAWKKNPATYRLLEKYVEGVNAYISSLTPAEYPVEYKLLGYAPELWSPLKTALFSKAMAETLASRALDISATNAQELWGQDNFDYIYQTWFPEESPIIPREVKWEAIKADLVQDSIQPLGMSFPKTGTLPFEEVDPTLGSNNWAVNAEKSTTGNPILCGDPHLRMSLPAVWFENQIHTPEYNAYGVSLPGVPGITIGFNEHIAWSMTNVGHDVSDFYAITWQDSTKQAYMVDNQAIPVTKRIETYKVRGGETVTDTVRYTRWGPVYLETEDDKSLALRWMVHDGADDNILGVAIKLNKAKNYEEYREAIRQFNTPAQNIVFASKSGDIGITVQGRFAIKRPNQGRFVLDGSDSKNAWQGFVPKAHVPAVKNPARNFVASANQYSTAPDYPYYYHSEGFEAYRGRYLNRQLAAKEKWSVQDMMDLQNDSYNLRAEEALPMMLNLLETSALTGTEKTYYEQLKKWDYRHERDQITPALFEEWFLQFYNLTWDEILEQDTYENVLKPRYWRTIHMLRDSLDAPYFDIKATPPTENGSAVVNQAFAKMVTVMDSLTTDKQDFNWANYNKVKVGHLARLAPFSRNDIYTSGSKNTLNAIRGQHGPSWRMVVDLGDKVTAKVVYPAGQSGNPGSAFYDNFIDYWKEGKYYDALFLEDANEQSERILYTQEFKK